MTVKEARRRWATRRRQYVVGYVDSGNCVFWDQYGKPPKPKRVADYAASDPMTLQEARTLLKQMPCRGAAIFRLVPIAVGGGAK